VWVATVFAEFMGPFNVLHQPLRLSALAWGFWAVCAAAEAYVLVLVLDRGRGQRLGLSMGRRVGNSEPSRTSRGPDWRPPNGPGAPATRIPRPYRGTGTTVPTRHTHKPAPPCIETVPGRVPPVTRGTFRVRLTALYTGLFLAPRQPCSSW